ncbi:hypothetical protein LINPERHAP1_LOCUS35823 [Linum perenne]
MVSRQSCSLPLEGSDGTVIFGKASAQEMLHIMNIVNGNGDITGQEINTLFRRCMTFIIVRSSVL